MPKKSQQPPRRILRGERRSSREVDKSTRRCCGLCGATANLTKTECCGQWICDDEDQYELFSYARNSCSRNHRRFTLCGHHHTEGHEGRWQDCSKCRDTFETEMYVYYGTNEYNFEKLPNPPAFEPTHCASCGKVIKLGEDGYSVLGSKYTCMDCGDPELRRLYSRSSRSLGALARRATN
jgi:predicted RNA-binding Zn-ribbon protein involved in translation (DUF1610 family)